MGETPQRADHLWLVIVVTVGVIVGFFMGFHLGYTTLAGVMVMVLADRKDPRDAFGRVDWALLLFFCCLFIVVAGLAKTGLVDRCWSASAEYLSFLETRGVVLLGPHDRRVQPGVKRPHGAARRPSHASARSNRSRLGPAWHLPPRSREISH